MTKQLRQRIAWALATSVLVVGHGVAQERGVALPASVREAQSVLIATYPELREGRIAWRVDETPTGAVVEARRAFAPLETSATPTPPLVGALVVSDEQGRLQALHAHGTLIERVRQQVASLAGSRVSEIEAHLRAAGAKFPPGESSAAEGLIPQGLQRTLAAGTVRDTQFRADGSADAPQEAIAWRVELDSDDASPRRYTLVFDPIEGRLLSVVRR